MKVLFVLDSLGTGGAERASTDLWYFLNKKDVEFEIVVLRHRTEGVEDEVLNAGFKVHFLKVGSTLSHAIQINAIIKSFKPDIVHSVLFNSNLRTRIAKIISKFKYTESLVNLTYDPIRLNDKNITSIKLEAYKWLDKLTSTQVDIFHAITNTVSIHYQQHLGVRKDRIKVIPRGRIENVNRSNIEKLRANYIKEFNLDDNGIIFLNVGRQEFQKGQDCIVKAVKRILDEEPNFKFYVLMAGREGSVSKELKEQIERLNVKESVKTIGHRYDIEKLMAVSDVFLFPSRFEGLGVSLIEAQAAALPIICSDIPVFREVVNDQIAEFVPVDDDRVLSSAMLKVGQDEEHRKRLSESSFENFRSKYRAEVIHQQMIEFFLDQVNSNNN